MNLDPLSPEAFTQSFQMTQNPEAADRQCHVHFFLDEMPDEEQTAKQGRPIFKSVEMCEIRYGDKDNVVVDRVKYMHPDPRQRFAVQYARFKAGEQTQVVGTLLRKWGLIDSAAARSYEAIGIFTVEQLAGLSDTNAQQVRGSLADRQKARDFLAMAEGQAPISQARAEIEKLREEIRALREGASVAPATVVPPAVGEPVTFAQDVPVKRKPGRPRKVVPPTEP